MILYSRREFARFKRRAQRRHPAEYLELLFGTITQSQLSIEKFVAVPQRGDEYYVNWISDHEAEDLMAETEATSGLEFIGTIHSHTLTHREAHIPSGLDNKSAHIWEERVFALDHIRKRNGRFTHSLAFYEPQQPLEDVAFF